MFDDFFIAIDRAWPIEAETRIPLRVIGSGALMLQTTYRRATNDGDVLETLELTKPTQAQLRALAGRGTSLHKQHGIFIDIVANGIPFLPHGEVWHPVSAINDQLNHFALSVLDVVDVAVSKLKRFHANDRSDVDAMVKRGLIDHAHFLARFRSAFDDASGGAGAADLHKIVRNLHTVERDMLNVDETPIELPDKY